MSKSKISSGVVHTVPMDLRQALLADARVHAAWEDITPLARNEWVCWVLDAKKLETRQGRIEKLSSKLRSGMRRPCCWVGCTHRP